MLSLFLYLCLSYIITLILRAEFLYIKFSTPKNHQATYSIHVQSESPGKHNEVQKQKEKLNYSSKFCKHTGVTLAYCKGVNQKETGQKS